MLIIYMTKSNKNPTSYMYMNKASIEQAQCVYDWTLKCTSWTALLDVNFSGLSTYTCIYTEVGWESP